MTDAELRDAAVAHLKLTNTGYLKNNNQPKPPPWPAGSTHWEPALDLLAQIGQAVPPPPPPPPPGAILLDQLSDFNGVFNAPYMTEIATPHGAGFNVSCPPAAAAPWDANMKAVLGKQARVGFLGQTDVWTVYLMYPSAGNPNGFPKAWAACAWWELHTNTDSGFHWGIDTGWAAPGNHFRFGYLLPGLTHQYDYYYSSFPVAFDTWYRMETTTKYSTGADGNVIAKIGPAAGPLETVVSRAGRTVDDSIALQLGWYSVGVGGGGNFPNQVQFGGVQRVTT